MSKISKDGKYTLKDLAEYTGFSKSTISRVFNNPDKVKKATLNKIQKAVNELDYQPSRVAQRLRHGQGKAKVIGLIIPDIMNPFFANLARGVEDVAHPQGYSLILNNSDEDMNRQKNCIDILRKEAVDGIILPPVNDSNNNIRDLLEAGIVVVCVDRKVQGTPVDSVVSDNRLGAYKAVSHLITLGHRRIAYISGISGISTSRERLQGYKDALREHDIEIVEEIILRGNSKQESGKQLTQQLLSLANPPSALFTGNNLMTQGALIACSQLGTKIPKDLVLVGYDDVPWAEALNPPPTVIDQSGYKIGKIAAERLLQRIQSSDQSPPMNISLDPTLIIRTSCGAKR